MFSLWLHPSKLSSLLSCLSEQLWAPVFYFTTTGWFSKTINYTLRQLFSELCTKVFFFKIPVTLYVYNNNSKFQKSVKKRETELYKKQSYSLQLKRLLTIIKHQTKSNKTARSCSRQLWDASLYKNQFKYCKHKATAASENTVRPGKTSLAGEKTIQSTV